MIKQTNNKGFRNFSLLEKEGTNFNPNPLISPQNRDRYPHF